MIVQCPERCGQLLSFSATVVVCMNNDLNESQIGQSYQTRGQMANECHLPEGGGKWFDIIYTYIFSIFEEYTYIFFL